MYWNIYTYKATCFVLKRGNQGNAMLLGFQSHALYYSNLPRTQAFHYSQ